MTCCMASRTSAHHICREPGRATSSTALSPVIGYDQASVIAHDAIDHNRTLKEAALANGVSEDLFDTVVNPIALTRGGTADVSPARPA
jgi:fumarate hydratase class II